MNTPESQKVLPELQSIKEQSYWPGRGVYLFPGQAAHEIGIGQELYNSSRAARAVFELASKMSGVDIRELCFEDSQGRLSDTLYVQLATGVVSIAAYRAAMEKYPEFRTVRPVGGAGVSFGEITNVIVSRAVSDPESAIKLVLERGNIMERVGSANPGRMAVVSRLSHEEALSVCSEAGVYPALKYHNYLTISGLNDRMDRALNLAIERGGRVVDNVLKYPLHTPHMEDAIPLFEEILEGIDFQDPSYPLVLNHNAEVTSSGQRIREQLSWGLTNCVDVVSIVDALKDNGGEYFIEFGPKPVLAPILARNDRSIRAVTVYDSNSLGQLDLRF